MKSSDANNKFKYVILTSSGGGGHTNAAEARKKELIDLGVAESEIAVIDLMGVYSKAKNYGNPWVPTYSILGFDPFFSGAENTEKWNASQKEGTEEAVRRLEYLVEMQPLAEAMQASEVQKKLTEFLKENEIRNIYNTQALSTPAICQAVIDYNKENNKQLEILTTVTDLITHRADHFLGSLKKLNNEHTEVLKMEISAAPLCDPGENEKEFYARYGIREGLFVPKASLAMEKDKIVRVEAKDSQQKKYPSPVKMQYLSAQTDEQKKTILVKAGNDKEQQYIKEALGESLKSSEKNNISIDKKPGDKLITITMGSQGSNTVIEYMEEFSRQIRENQENIKNKDGNIFLCIAAGKNEPNSLYQKSILRAKELMKDLDPEISSKVKILPLAFQDAEHMSSLLNNSDVLITRSGGMSSMEAEATHGRNPNRQVFVHSEAKLKYPDLFPRHSFDATYEALMRGTVKWEGGNAEYLLRNINASLGSPELIDFGFANQDKSSPGFIKENSLFHFAFDNKLNSNNLAKIESLIREGSNPNMRFPGGSYLIDHCKDFETKILLVKYGANLTAKSIEGISKEQEQQLKAAVKEYKRIGSPKEPIYTTSLRSKDQIAKEKLGYRYLHPLEPNNLLEKIIVGMDKIGDFVKNKILRINDMHDALDGLRFYLQTDPTEKRNVVKRLRQARNFTINSIIFIAKQPVNMIIKPLAMLSNITKSGLISLGMLVADAREEKSNISNYQTLKETSSKALKDFGESLVAWGTSALVFSGFGAPVALTLFGSTATLSLGAASFGSANAATYGLNNALTSAVAASQTPAANAVLTAEGVAEWGVARPFLYFALDPKDMYYEKGSKDIELNTLGKKVHELHQQSINQDISIEVRRKAVEEIKKIQGIQMTDKVYTPIVNTITPLLRTNNGKQDNVRK